MILEDVFLWILSSKFLLIIEISSKFNLISKKSLLTSESSFNFSQAKANQDFISLLKWSSYFKEKGTWKENKL